eukprot:s430_g13.t1
MFTSHGVLLLHALDALLSTSLVVVVTAASDGMRFSAIYALLPERGSASREPGHLGIYEVLGSESPKNGASRASPLPEVR